MQEDSWTSQPCWVLVECRRVVWVFVRSDGGFTWDMTLIKGGKTRFKKWRQYMNKSGQVNRRQTCPTGQLEVKFHSPRLLICFQHVELVRFNLSRFKSGTHSTEKYVCKRPIHSCRDHKDQYIPIERDSQHGTNNDIMINSNNKHSKQIVWIMLVTKQSTSMEVDAYIQHFS